MLQLQDGACPDHDSDDHDHREKLRHAEVTRNRCDKDEVLTRRIGILVQPTRRASMGSETTVRLFKGGQQAVNPDCDRI